MNNYTVKVLPVLTKNYGEIIFEMTAIMNNICSNFSNNQPAKNDLIEILLDGTIKFANSNDILNSQRMQGIFYKYTGARVFAKGIGSGTKKCCTPISVELINFVSTKIWPIIIKHYITYFDSERHYIPISIVLGNKMWEDIYGSENFNVFFKEFNELLIYNHIMLKSIESIDGDNQRYKFYIPIVQILD